MSDATESADVAQSGRPTFNAKPAPRARIVALASLMLVLGVSAAVAVLTTSDDDRVMEAIDSEPMTGAAETMFTEVTTTRRTLRLPFVRDYARVNRSYVLVRTSPGAAFDAPVREALASGWTFDTPLPIAPGQAQAEIRGRKPIAGTERELTLRIAVESTRTPWVQDAATVKVQVDVEAPRSG